MKIKTFPLQFTEDYLDKVRKIATDNNMSMKELMLSAIEEKMEKLEKGEWMKVTIIDGRLEDYINEKDDGCISVFETNPDYVVDLVYKVLNDGKTVILESAGEGE